MSERVEGCGLKKLEEELLRRGVAPLGGRVCDSREVYKLVPASAEAIRAAISAAAEVINKAEWTSVESWYWHIEGDALDMHSGSNTLKADAGETFAEAFQRVAEKNYPRVPGSISVEFTVKFSDDDSPTVTISDARFYAIENLLKQYYINPTHEILYKITGTTIQQRLHPSDSDFNNGCNGFKDWLEETINTIIKDASTREDVEARVEEWLQNIIRAVESHVATLPPVLGEYRISSPPEDEEE